MGAVKKHDRLVKKYLKKTGRFKTLKELEKSIDKKQKKGLAYLKTLNYCNFRRKKADKAQFCYTESARKS